MARHLHRRARAVPLVVVHEGAQDAARRAQLVTELELA